MYSSLDSSVMPMQLCLESVVLLYEGFNYTGYQETVYLWQNPDTVEWHRASYPGHELFPELEHISTIMTLPETKNESGSRD